MKLCRKSFKSVASPSKQQLVFDAGAWVGYHAYIESDLLPDRMWQVKGGAGMGTRHAGAICDAALGMTERPLLTPANLAAYE